ncbi:MAG: DUF308 domain-containing protein [Oscillospiraceae bacterium]|nr:DUF308 domain-containing protein [Oscillospiraceae bacterium]
MTLTQRIGKILNAAFTVLGVLIMVWMGEDGFFLVSFLLSLSMILFGLRKLLFYFTMARHMVDGRSILYIGVIALDFGVFSLSVSRNVALFITLYLLGTHGFAGVMDILRAREARRFKSPSWRLSLATGVVNLAFGVSALFFCIVSAGLRELTLIYAAGLLFAAISRLVRAFRKTAIVYIQ